MPDVKRTVKLVTHQEIIDEDSGQEGFPMRKWHIEIYLIDENGADVTANIFEKVIYRLHPTFPKPNQTFKKHPFRIEEKGWGEFDMQIELHLAHKGGIHTLDHDLNFQSEQYIAKHDITIKNPKAELLALLQESGSTGVNGARGGKRDDATKKRSSRKDKMVDMEKLADGLQRLGEEDLLQVVQMIHDNKTSDTYTKNDVDKGEFHVDLYTLPDPLVKSLWDFTQAKTDL
ncbi:SAS complex, SAS5 subunit/transcription initiation factor IID, subunit 14 [Pseudovirgaria hyperparasitica]|uniref:SAS complex, SAS5 subunit/transcription initiation factor IID, subunit 14 n=1 Tax=Pseudovirgaria hyperparasitica TaxID=470096 RepID=A0A6A6WCQ2_9PEZI|nr:SAS complex, SAS5 subunit/transcription initiation factor IID, subunit 14 [Pseudovirgaria hyperparasitica]KAF2758881.1 SAS complex, SAS5 subunit/transcription initiation factor IID, subunit 14 [Pseudovirgaria hyperparasitica]